MSRNRLVHIGALGAPVAVRQTLVTVQAVRILPSQRPGYQQVRLQGGFIYGYDPGVLPRSQYYLGFDDQRFTARRTGTGLRMTSRARASEYRIAFELPDRVIRAATRSGVRVRFVFSPPGWPLTGRRAVGAIILNLAEAARS